MSGLGVLKQIRDAVEAYETDDCKTEIVSFSIIDGGGSVLNTGEKFQFKVKVTNDGELDMKNVKVTVSGTMYADVATTRDGTYDESVATPVSFDLPACHPPPTLLFNSHTTEYFYGLAKEHTGGVERDIVTARISTWDASWDHILMDHAAGRGEPEAKLLKE